MAKSSRRSFIKKNLLTGLFFTSAIPLVKANNLLGAKHTAPILKTSTSNYNTIDWDNIRQQFLFPKQKHYLNTGKTFVK